MPSCRAPSDTLIRALTWNDVGMTRREERQIVGGLGRTQQSIVHKIQLRNRRVQIRHLRRISRQGTLGSSIDRKSGVPSLGSRPSVRPLSMRARRSLRLHKLLGLEADAAYARVRSSYQQKVRKCHPDACGTASAGNCDEFLKVQSAWEEYKDSASVRAAEGPAATSRTTRSELQMVLFKLKIDQGAETDHHPRAAARALATVPMRAFVRQ